MIWRLIKPILTAVTLDTVSLSPNASHEPLGENLRLVWRDNAWWQFKQQTRLGRFTSSLWAIKAALKWVQLPLPSRCVGEAAFFAFTTNQLDAITPVGQALAQQGTPTHVYKEIEIGSVDRDADTPLEGCQIEEGIRALGGWGRLLAIPFFPCMLVRMLTTRGYRGRSFTWALDEHWWAYGLYVACRWWLQSARPAAIFLSNDHNVFPCTLDKAARDLGIPTFYLQHACVTNNFPPLRVTYALLDGRDALEKYAGAGPSESTAFLVGMAKSDAYVGRINQSDTVRRLGVCLSMADDLDRAEAMLSAIAAADLGMEVTIRPHPRSSPEVLARVQAVLDRHGYRHSGLEEKAFDFLARQDALVGGVSAMTLEAALLNVTPIHYALNDSNNDWYGFLKQGLCRSFATPAELIDYLQAIRDDRPDASDLSAFYCETVGTRHHGHAAQLAASLVASVVNGVDPVDDAWAQLDGVRHVTAYGLAERAAD